MSPCAKNFPNCKQGRRSQGGKGHLPTQILAKLEAKPAPSKAVYITECHPRFSDLPQALGKYAENSNKLSQLNKKKRNVIYIVEILKTQKYNEL